MCECADRQLHELEREFGMPADQILDVINRRNRCKIAVRGAIAEAHLLRHLEQLHRRELISGFNDLDLDGQPDFEVFHTGRKFMVECKNVRKRGKGPIDIDFQRTRNQKADEGARFYKPEEFDVIAACLYNRTGEWTFLFAATSKLTSHDKHPGRLAPKQIVDPTRTDIWTPDLGDLLSRIQPHS